LLLFFAIIIIPLVPAYVPISSEKSSLIKNFYISACKNARKYENKLQSFEFKVNISKVISLSQIKYEKIIETERGGRGGKKDR